MTGRIGLGVLVALLLAWLAGAVVTNAVDLSTPLAGRHECPHDWTRTGLHQVAVPLEEPGPIANVPEFHDCQRFIVVDPKGNLVYDSLYAIFASFNLPRLSARLDSLDSLSDGPGKLGLPGAQIWTDKGHYELLGIKTVLSCLYLFHGTRWPEIQEWQARVLPGDESRGRCAPSIEISDDRATPLEVKPSTFPGARLMEEDFPPVARWDWDSTHQRQYIGIKCGAAWCEVGAPGFAPSAPLKPPASLPRKAQRVYLVKGWYDEQLLAPARGSHGARPTAIKATIIPDPALGDYTTADQFAGKWTRAAEVVLSSPSPDYKKKFNFDPGRVFERTNTLYLCYGTRYRCFGIGAILAWWAYPSCTSGKTWWERIVAVDGKIMHKCEVRRPHNDPTQDSPNAPPVPGTTRWRWQADDETTWKRCLQGCCEPA